MIIICNHTSLLTFTVVHNKSKLSIDYFPKTIKYTLRSLSFKFYNYGVIKENSLGPIPSGMRQKLYQFDKIYLLVDIYTKYNIIL